MPILTGPIVQSPASPAPATGTTASTLASAVRILSPIVVATNSTPSAVPGQASVNPAGFVGTPQEVRSEPSAARPAPQAIQLTDAAALTSAGVPVPAGAVMELIPNPQPVESVVDRALDVIFPDGVPFLGPITVDPIPAGVMSTLARFGSLADAVPDDGVSAERWAWLSAGALAVAGAYVSVRPSRRRRLAAPGAGSELARWETRHAGGSP
jgi:hypothetical protein